MKSYHGLGRQVHFLDFGGVRLAKTFIRKTENKIYENVT